MKMVRSHLDKKFNENLDKFLKSFENSVYKPDILATYGAGWDDCQTEILELLKNNIKQKEYAGYGLDGEPIGYWNYIDEKVIKEIEKL